MTTDEKLKEVRYMAVCLACNARRDVPVMPVEPWPLCEECGQAMEVCGTSTPTMEK